MNAKTLTALKGSIRKWEKIAAGTGVDLGDHNCPLCKLFLRQDDEERLSCFGCPVYEATRLSLCRGTPYADFRSLGFGVRANTPKQKREARRELAFLKGLLPKGKK